MSSASPQSAGKKAVLVGGSGGIGLSVARCLAERGWRLAICSRSEPKADALPEGSYEWRYLDLADYDYALVRVLAADSEVGLLMVTAGFGRVARFEDLHPGEIHRLVTVNLSSALRIISAFYGRINGDDDFYCGVMGSIAGLVSSPLFSVYAAAKAGICRFCESVNVELEAAGRKNRILNVSPGFVEGTRFGGGEDDPSKTRDLAEDIVRRLLAREEFCIPAYEETFKGVIEGYRADSLAFGLHSYERKMSSGRLSGRSGAKVGYLSGTFDLFHVGHLNLLRRAKQQCDYLVVGVHASGAWKGKETFVPLDERKAMVGACRYVDEVIDAPGEDDAAWDICRYDMLFVGSDYKGTERFARYEAELGPKGVQIVYFPYTEGTSSTQLREALYARAAPVPYCSMTAD